MSNLYRLFGYLRPYFSRMVGAVCAMLVVAAATATIAHTATSNRRPDLTGSALAAGRLLQLYLHQLEARGMSLEGQQIRLDRRTNQLWIDRAGELVVPVDRDLEIGLIFEEELRRAIHPHWAGPDHPS